MKYCFPAILENDEEDENVINVTFPDILGAFTFGIGRDEAIKMAKDALKEFLINSPEYRDVEPASLDDLSERFEDVVMVEVEL